MATATGVRVRSCDLRWPKLAAMPLLLPPVEEQARIADYLDIVCADIDSAYDDTEEEIALLKAYKQATITEAVTKGLDPDVEMKDSGVEWIGGMPGTWRLVQVKRIASIGNGSNPHSEGDVPVYGSGSAAFKTCGEFKEGPTVLLGRKGATLHIPCYILGRYWNVDTAFDVKTSLDCDLRFFYYLAVSFDYDMYKTQTTLPSMTQTDYGRMWIPLPPKADQQRIVEFLDSQCSAIDEQIADLESQLAMLSDLKKSIIYDYVTGKAEVPESFKKEAIVYAC